MSQILIPPQVWANLAVSIEHLMLATRERSKLELQMQGIVTRVINPTTSTPQHVHVAIHRWIRRLRVINAQSYTYRYPGKVSGVSGAIPWRKGALLADLELMRALNVVCYNISGAPKSLTIESAEEALDALIFLAAKRAISSGSGQ